jgi:hypothetical protein
MKQLLPQDLPLQESNKEHLAVKLLDTIQEVKLAEKTLDSSYIWKTSPNKKKTEHFMEAASVQGGGLVMYDNSLSVFTYYGGVGCSGQSATRSKLIFFLYRQDSHLPIKG